MTTKQDSLVKGTIILALAAFIARFLGIAQRVPLNYIMGDAGSAPYGHANNIYLTLLPIATAGIPSALSKLVAEKTALGRSEEAERIFQAAIRFAVVAGIVITVPMIALSPLLAGWAGMPEATLSIIAIAPALLLFPIIAMLRGYFQGRQMMMAGGLSQIWEQIFRVLTAVLLAAGLSGAGYGIAVVSAGASFGGVLGAAAALAVMLYYLRRLRRDEATMKRTGNAAAEPLTETKSIFRSLLKLSIPISLYSSTVSLINTIDSSLGVPLLHHFMAEDDAKALIGILTTKAQSLAGIAVVFAVAVSQSLVPIISGAFSRGDMQEVRRKSFQALFLALVSGTAVIAVIAAGAEPLNALLFPYLTGTGVIAFLTIVTLFQIMMMTSGAILMGMGRMRMLLYNLALCVGVKLAMSFLLTPYMTIYGMLTATGLCYLAAVTMNILYLKRTIGLVFLGKRWTGIIVTAAVLLGAGYGVHMLNHLAVHPFGGDSTLAVKLNALIQCIVAGLVMGALYVLLLFGTRVMTLQELAAMPGPAGKLLKRFGLRAAGSKSAES